MNLSGNELTRNSSENTRSQSSQLAEPLWTDPGLKSGISVRKLISTKKKNVQAGNELFNILPKILACKKKASNDNSYCHTHRQAWGMRRRKNIVFILLYRYFCFLLLFATLNVGYSWLVTACCVPSVFQWYFLVIWYCPFLAWPPSCTRIHSESLLCYIVSFYALVFNV